jgi:hypothetical protein
MTERDYVTVNDPQAPVNNGGGHQYVFYGVGVGADWMIRKGSSPSGSPEWTGCIWPTDSFRLWVIASPPISCRSPDRWCC